MWWFIIADDATAVYFTDVAISIALVKNKQTSGFEQLSLVTCDVSRAFGRSNNRVSIVVAVENECNNAPEDMNICHIENRVPKWHKFVTSKENGQPLSCVCSVYDSGSLVTSCLALKDCKYPIEFRNWINASEVGKRCRFVVCSFSPPMMSDDSFLVSFGWLQPLKSPQRLTVPWPLESVASVFICASLSANYEIVPESVTIMRRATGSARSVFDFLRQNIIICPADTSSVKPLSTSFEFVCPDLQCVQLTQTVAFLSESLYWIAR
jgi:hypothetical protein